MVRSIILSAGMLAHPATSNSNADLRFNLPDAANYITKISLLFNLSIPVEENSGSGLSVQKIPICGTSDGLTKYRSSNAGASDWSWANFGKRLFRGCALDGIGMSTTPFE